MENINILTDLKTLENLAFPILEKEGFKNDFIEFIEIIEKGENKTEAFKRSIYLKIIKLHNEKKSIKNYFKFLYLEYYHIFKTRINKTTSEKKIYHNKELINKMYNIIKKHFDIK